MHSQACRGHPVEGKAAQPSAGIQWSTCAETSLATFLNYCLGSQMLVNWVALDREAFVADKQKPGGLC